MTKHIIVIGGGISGLAAAHRLTELGRTGSLDLRVTLLEASDRLGGVIATEHADDLLIELGPDSYITDKPAALRLCERLGLADRLIAPQQGALKLYTVHRGALTPLPEGISVDGPHARGLGAAQSRVLLGRQAAHGAGAAGAPARRLTATRAWHRSCAAGWGGRSWSASLSP